MFGIYVRKKADYPNEHFGFTKLPDIRLSILQAEEDNTMEAVYAKNFIIKDTNSDPIYHPAVSYARRTGFWGSGRRTFRRRRRNTAILPLFAVAAILLFGIAALLLMPPKRATAKDSIYETHLVSVRVEQGDSLWKIAERYYCSEKESIPDFVTRIKKANHLESDTIYPDTYLLIQYSIPKDGES